MMKLGEVIQRLAAENGDLVLPYGIEHPHSYRGYYERLAFELDREQPSTIDDWLALLRSVDGRTFQGWKGGEYVMGLDSLVYIANEGDTGEPITKLWLDALIALAKKP